MKDLMVSQQNYRPNSTNYQRNYNILVQSKFDGFAVKPMTEFAIKSTGQIQRFSPVTPGTFEFSSAKSTGTKRYAKSKESIGGQSLRKKTRTFLTDP